MLSQKLSLENLIKKEAAIRQLLLLFNNLEVHKRCPLSLTLSVKEISNRGSNHSKRRCKIQWGNIVEMPQQPLWLNHWKHSSRAHFLKLVWWVFNWYGLIKSQKLLKKDKKKIKVPSSQRRNKLKKCYNNWPIYVCNPFKHPLKEQRLRHLLQYTSIKEILLLKWNAKTFLILIGKSKQDCIGKVSKILVWSVLLIGNKDTAMNFWEPKKDCVLLL